MARHRAMKLLILLTLFYGYLVLRSNNTEVTAGQFSSSGHTNNWAVLVSTSRHWFNYRHVAGTLSMYRTVKRLGIPDSHIILMLADDVACSHRNPKPAAVFSDKHMGLNVYGDGDDEATEVDYRGFEVTAETLLRVLTDRLPRGTPRSKRLLSDSRSNVLVFLTGHGGDGFMRLQDTDGDVGSGDLADAVEQMWRKRRYSELLLVVDTCQAASMYERLRSPNVMAVASSLVGEDSTSYGSDPDVGVALLDRYTFHLLRFLEGVRPGSNTSMDDLFRVCPKPSQCTSTPSRRTDLFRRDPGGALVTDFFGGVRNVELTEAPVDLSTDLEEPRPEEEKAAVRGGDLGRTGGQSYADQLPVSEIVGQKPKQKDWHPPDGFVLSLWAIVLLVAFTTLAHRTPQTHVPEGAPATRPPVH